MKTRIAQRRPHARSRRSAGFTLLELMVALATGTLVILAAYTLAGATTRQFQEQQRIASLQSSVRLAMDQVQRDVERAGYLAMPNARNAPRCGDPLFFTQALEHQDDVADNVVDPLGENLVHADRLRLVGSFSTPDQFFVSGVSPAFDEIYLQPAWQAFRRNFASNTDATGNTIDPDAVSSVFLPGRMIMLRATTGNVFYSNIVGVTVAGSQVSVRINPQLPVGGPCLGGMAGGAVVSVLSRIEYSAVGAGDPAVASLNSVNPNAAQMGIFTSVLLRREVTFDAGATPLPQIGGSALERVVLENLAEFDLSFIISNDLVTPALMQRVTGPAMAQWAASINDNPAARPERLRAVRVALSARSNEQDSRYPWVARGAADPFSRFHANAFPGSARVRSMNAEISLPNLR